MNYDTVIELIKILKTLDIHPYNFDSDCFLCLKREYTHKLCQKCDKTLSNYRTTYSDSKIPQEDRIWTT